MQLLAYVDPSNQLSINVQLRVCGPIRVLLEAVPHLLILEDVETSVFDIRIVVQEVNNALGEATLSCLRGALHEEHYLLLVDEFL